MAFELNFGFFFTTIIFLTILGHCEMSIYPGLRRKPLVQTVQQSLEVSPDYLSQLMEENARRKLHQQFEQQLELINYQMRLQQERQQLFERYRNRQQKLSELVRSGDDYIDQINANKQQYSTNVGQLRERPEFAVGPFDPRYYVNNEENKAPDEYDLSPKELEEYQEYVPIEKGETNEQKLTNIITKENSPVLAPAPVETSKLKDNSMTANFHRIKPQLSASSANAAIVPDLDLGKLENHHIKNAKGQNPEFEHDNIVVREHIGFSSDLGVYIIALIAGVSAAFTVGLIALGIVWVQNRTKATGDVDYPAYGITGPNRDASPSGDRKLAQSAQMYHYQHQKQQIIAMENQQAGEGCCALSDVDSDDDNEEGDYTVYECPGLAPTGEMEVKNPLFLDETPATPLKNLANTHITLQQPQVNLKDNKNVPGTLTNEKKHKKNKN